jgi:protein O-GlcNAc transferase
VISEPLSRAAFAWIRRVNASDALDILLATCLKEKERALVHAACDFADSIGVSARRARAQLDALQPKVDPARVAFAHVQLADCWRTHRQDDYTMWHLRTALAMNPASKSAFARLFNLYAENHRLDEAEHAARAILKHLPTYYDALVLLAGAVSGQGRVPEALAILEHAIGLAPERVEARSRWLFESQHVPNLSDRSRLALANEYGACQRNMTLGAEALAAQIWSPNELPSKPKRIGFVSTDLHEHPVGYFLLDFMTAAANRGVRFHVYQLSGANDAMTAKLKAVAEKWVALPLATDREIASIIGQDRLHMLFDLTGHAPFNRLGVFRYRIAPIQLTWLGYFGTTGLAEMDYILVDPVSVPSSEFDSFSERSIYLPDTRLCFSTPERAPDVAPLPAARNGFITFGCFQTIGKMNAEVVELWARVLRAVSGSRLRIQCTAWRQPALKDAMLRNFDQHGIDRSRIDLASSTNREEYLKAYAEVDLILDTFPFQGGTTTCEALWMGVPTITLLGSTMASRQGASLLEAAGLAQWVAASKDGYVELATKTASNLEALSELRATLRQKVRSSSLFDSSRFADAWIAAVERAWTDYVGKATHRDGRTMGA